MFKVPNESLVSLRDVYVDAEVWNITDTYIRAIVTVITDTCNDGSLYYFLVDTLWYFDRVTVSV